MTNFRNYIEGMITISNKYILSKEKEEEYPNIKEIDINKIISYSNFLYIAIK